MPTCPNCSRPMEKNHPIDVCLVAALFGVVRDRGNKTDDRIKKLMRDVNVDLLWDDLGPLIDRLEKGYYS